VTGKAIPRLARPAWICKPCRRFLQPALRTPFQESSLWTESLRVRLPCSHHPPIFRHSAADSVLPLSTAPAVYLIDRTAAYGIKLHILLLGNSRFPRRDSESSPLSGDEQGEDDGKYRRDVWSKNVRGTYKNDACLSGFLVCEETWPTYSVGLASKERGTRLPIRFASTASACVNVIRRRPR